jgi:hypothetical protein
MHAFLLHCIPVKLAFVYSDFVFPALSCEALLAAAAFFDANISELDLDTAFTFNEFAIASWTLVASCSRVSVSAGNTNGSNSISTTEGGIASNPNAYTKKFGSVYAFVFHPFGTNVCQYLIVNG